MKFSFWVVAAQIAAISWLTSASSATQFVLWAECVDDGILLRLSANDDGERPELVGFHVYRRTLGFACDEPIRVTEEPLRREPGVTFSVESRDHRVEPNVNYEYWLVGVDEDEEVVAGVGDGAWAHCGDRAPVAHGVIHDRAWTLAIEPVCDASCNSAELIVEWPPGLEPLVNTDSAVLLYGSVAWHPYDGLVILATDWDLMACTTMVEPSAWGSVKNLFK